MNSPIAGNLGTHEILELHEILSFKNVCLTKSAAMQNLVQDPNLKNIIVQDITQSKQDIQELQNVLAKV
ncbi:spore coat protein [Paenibacillus sp. OAS669]|uniref:spore coat protein n=1 Tax=Paenibacillus sp. OAS669 TaxID=2663821 RepID=UPI0019F7A1AC|nr:spore coat protein [Paenibacillus sp. OAS669]MBE1440853.1 hypothetical protein [Paenibacillus sp. OAS669]